MRRSEMRQCMDCGRLLAPGEVCECRQRVKGTRDGLRARCPKFEHRSSYRGRHYISCRGQLAGYDQADARNEHYRAYCCGEYGRCERYSDE